MNLMREWHLVWLKGAIVALALMGWSSLSLAGEWPQLGQFYPDGHGGFVYFPLADTSFADEVVKYQMGDPPPSSGYRFSRREALGIPDYSLSPERGYLTLGCRGTLTVQFVDNALVDVPGPDLYVFEIGDAVEPTKLEISTDGTAWEDVGAISGGRAEVDIAAWAVGGTSFRYVRLTDLGSDCGPGTPGADIDAVGAIGSGLRLTLKGKVLFDFGKAELKPDASRELDGLAGHFSDVQALAVEVDGHTDAIGTAQANQSLSEKRAQAVATYLVERFQLPPGSVRAVGRGESQPLAENTTDAGRQANRRVEIVITRLGRAESGAGLWRSNIGPLAMVVGSDGKLAARYPEDNGRWYGEKHGRVISGYWVENGSAQTCETAKDGSRHWGRIHIEMNQAGDEFTGWWSYCDADTHDGDLSGSRAR